MKKLLAAILLLTLNVGLFAQKKITLQSGNNSSFYSTIDSALLNAVNGDIIYVPGGSYVIPSLVIDKGVQIFGAGHYPDSTLATGQTILSGEVRILSGADNGSLSGCYIQGNVFFGTGPADQTVNNFGISRCSMNTLHMSFDGNTTNTSMNLYISENVIRGSLYGGNCINTLYRKNIINGFLHSHSSSVFENNLFMLSSSGCYSYWLNNVNGSVFRNNIISWGDGGCGTFTFSGSAGNVFYNNLFRLAANNYFPSGTNIQYNNYFGFIDTDVFSTGTAYSFSYSEDYHMLPTCIAHNGGTDGTDPGIYGSLEPYKPSAVPANPHIRTKAIGGSTDASGNLNVNITVGAQDK